MQKLPKKKNTARETKKKAKKGKTPKEKLLKKKTTGKRQSKKIKKETKEKKQSSAIQLIKAEENPIIAPRPEYSWEAWQTFNPGVILLDDKVHFLYRAIGQNGISRFGYASSNDGFTIEERLPHPVYEHRLTSAKTFNYFSFASGGSFGGAEDPRIVRVDNEETLYMTYTACDEGLRVALTSIKVKDFLQKKWNWKSPNLISPPGETHKNWVIFPEKISGKYAILHSISPEISIDYRDNLEFQEGEYIQSYYDRKIRKNCWDSFLRGAGAPPLRTDKGWLLFYHAIDKSDFGKYKAGVMLLDLRNPTKILHRSPEPILEPKEDYENNGFKGGIVYISGAIIKDGELLVYYGASDSYVSVAHTNLENFLESLTKETRPKLKTKTLKKKK